MRRLVYRVQPLPQSLLPLVWDFGQLNSRTEDLYIRQMVRRYVSMISFRNHNFFGCAVRRPQSLPVHRLSDVIFSFSGPLGFTTFL